MWEPERDARLGWGGARGTACPQRRMASSQGGSLSRERASVLVGGSDGRMVTHGEIAQMRKDVQEDEDRLLIIREEMYTYENEENSVRFRWRDQCHWKVCR